VNIQQGKYGIRLSVPSMDGMSDLWLRCDNETQYAQWMAACRLAAKGKTLADITFDQVNSLKPVWFLNTGRLSSQKRFFVLPYL
jgi:hypothetical protein